ncbi:MAG: bile acid:sodium symporter [Spirochaetaceae bacterium]|jgi:ACR3 family arsenite efflux pump ArsB|nr:bile acid:sodium symporter [Spirochaetaceae bacterium]
MSFLSKFQPLFIILSALTGIVIGKVIPVLERYAGNCIEIFLIAMLFFVFLNVELKNISKSFSDLRFSLSALTINFVITPLFAFALSKLFLAGQIDLQTGFIMLMVTPCTDWYLVFTGIANGNVPLGASILPLNLILQIILLPLYLLLFTGSEVSFALVTVVYSILFVLIIPLAAANGVQFAAKRINRQNNLAKLLKKSDDIQFLLLCLAIISMFASEGTLLLDNTLIFIKLLPPLLLFFSAIFCLSFLAGKMLKLHFSGIIPLIFTTSARNSPVSLAIAAITFPSRPLISLVLVMGPLIELPVLALNALILKRIESQRLRPGYRKNPRLS